MNDINKEIKNKIRKNLEQNYNIKLTKIEKSEESTDGNVFIIYVKNKRYIAKVYDNIIHTKQMLDLHLLLTEKSINAPRIIKDMQGNYYEKIEDNIYLMIYSFIKGKKLESFYKNKKTLDEELVKLIAKTLREFHDSTNLDEVKNKEIDFPKVPFEVSKSTKRKSILHFDLTKGNIIINKNKVNFIDFDDCKYGEAVCDVAIILSFLFLSKTNGIDLNNIKLFLKEYYNDDEMQKRETPLIKEYGLKWINYLLNMNKFDTSLKESFTEKRRLIKKYFIDI